MIKKSNSFVILQAQRFWVTLVSSICYVQHGGVDRHVWGEKENWEDFIHSDKKGTKAEKWGRGCWESGWGRTSQRAVGLRRNLQRGDPGKIFQWFHISIYHKTKTALKMTMCTGGQTLICREAHMGLSPTLLWGLYLSEALLCGTTPLVGWIGTRVLRQLQI